MLGLLGHNSTEPGPGMVVCLCECTMRVVSLVILHFGGTTLFQLEMIYKSSQQKTNVC